VCVDWERFAPKRHKEVETTPTFWVLPTYTPPKKHIFANWFRKVTTMTVIIYKGNLLFLFRSTGFEQTPRIFLATAKRDFHANDVTMTSLTRPTNLKQWVAAFQTQACLHW